MQLTKITFQAIKNNEAIYTGEFTTLHPENKRKIANSINKALLYKGLTKKAGDFDDIQYEVITNS
ncbi:hypothetical protein SAMN05192533_102317 [Mesobacillus persicus]|uniref:DUF1659 domain-containing protein n=1 Tax=Mesobacillus persicus TaxID=930146 RepID=A0A1H7XQF6_9BACI|nr:hypothetical protein [Mesobacillus persicus]SEM35971.1 hypothetical protein SAMN05192533_102317 [Mesobacillus persicus]